MGKEKREIWDLGFGMDGGDVACARDINEVHRGGCSTVQFEGGENGSLIEGQLTLEVILIIIAMMMMTSKALEEVGDDPQFHHEASSEDTAFSCPRQCPTQAASMLYDPHQNDDDDDDHH
ncbi:unnamed protein product [Prunus armeniaca]|uniref:Uncharacterized protein n=1 Tax=Prunus armeniaca TaxID=36596 RepID=A0A6J5XB31_PRUAR|nr:unnamed protein product [Prunus armeniaca]